MQLAKTGFSHKGRLLVGLGLIVQLLLLAQLPSVTAVAQAPPNPVSAVGSLSQDIGTAGLTQALRRLQNTARLMQVVAHPDDEDGGMLTLESRGQGVTVTLMTLTRGEGGQNKVGSNLFDSLGVLRTLELTASDRYYGVEQRFSRVADFGFSKTADETFQKWHGHDVALADIVRVVRTFRPDVLIARFSGTERDGHGHHQASAILTKEAFRAAADPTRFPEQIKEGLRPWQAKKLYVGNVCPFFANACPDENYTVKLNTGKTDPALGTGYVQFAMEGLRHQLSQGAGGWKIDPGDRFTFYKLADSVLSPVADKKEHEQGFFDGIDTSLPGLASKLGTEEKKVPWLRPDLKKAEDAITAATSVKDPGEVVPPLESAVRELEGITARVEKSSLNPAGKDELLQVLREKQQQAQAALALALDLSLQATVLLPQAESDASTGIEAPSAISPGQKFAVSVKLHNGSKYPVQVQSVSLEGLPSPSSNEKIVLQPDKENSLLFQVQLPVDFETTRPYWHRDDPGRDSLYQVDDPRYATLPFPPFRSFAKVRYSVMTNGTEPGPVDEIKAPITIVANGASGERAKRPLAIVPAFSVLLDAPEQVVPVEDGKERHVKVTIESNLTNAPRGTLHLELPAGWHSEPEQAPIELHRRGEKQEIEFKVFPGNLKEGNAEIRAVLSAGGKKYAEGYSLITREDLNAFYYYQPATQSVSIIDVKVPKDLKVGYIMGAGDDIPTVLKQIGVNVNEVPAEGLASADLGQYGTIVLGIRAYDTQKDVTANNKKLLDFVSMGGTLLVQYNTSVQDFNSGHFTPYAAQLSRARVSVEEAPVELLAPADSVFHSPNEITQRDFNGWVQERGLYFMSEWDSKFTALLACNDPGEPPQKGGLLRAQYGKGTYIYTGYAFFRQLPAGVPGAVRLFVNLLNAGH